MGIQEKIQRRVLEYVKNNLTEVLHTTVNPEGPGVVRVHLLPPAIVDGEVSSSVAIINGQDIIPIGNSWTILLAELIKEVNKYSGREITEDETERILANTCKNVRKIYMGLGKKQIRDDIYTIMNTFRQVAYGEEVDEEIHYMNIGDYAPYMKAPHRMDLLVSSMAVDGKWHCNQKCIHCYAAGQECAEEKELSTDDWKRIIDKCREACIPQITFTGGEPTMREDIVELVEYSSWFVTRLNTNGIKLTSKLCESLAKASLDSMQITFYSENEEIHNKLVGADQYKNTVAGIENALAAGISVSINTPLCTLNEDYVKTLEFLHGKQVTYVTCSGLITTGAATNDESVNLQLEPERLKKILKDAIDFCFSHGMEISFTSPGWIEREFFVENGINEPNCGACLSNMAITPSGNVVPCQSFLTGAVLGNMLEDSWDKIWNNDKCIERREYSAKMLGACPLRREKQ